MSHHHSRISIVSILVSSSLDILVYLYRSVGLNVSILSASNLELLVVTCKIEV